MEIVAALSFLTLPISIAAIVWWFRAAGGIVRAANALERIADHLERERNNLPAAAPAVEPPPVLRRADVRVIGVPMR